MAMMTETHVAAPASEGGLIARIFGRLGERMVQYGAYRRCVAELSALSDRDLRDLGMHRSMIRSMAYEEAYRNV